MFSFELEAIRGLMDFDRCVAWFLIEMETTGRLICRLECFEFVESNSKYDWWLIRCLIEVREVSY